MRGTSWWSARRFGLYSGLELGIGHVRTNIGPGHTDLTGFALAASTGVLLLRHSDINLDLRFRLLVIADQMNGAVPVLGGITLGVRF